MPELLAIGDAGELFVEIPANITFDLGDLYQLWLQARNGEGSSPAGPKKTGPRRKPPAAGGRVGRG